MLIEKPLTLKAATTGVKIAPAPSTPPPLPPVVPTVADPLIKITSQDVNLVGLTLQHYDVVAVEVDTMEEDDIRASLTSTAHWNIEYCSFVGTGINIKNLTDFKVMAENNWWDEDDPDLDGPEPGTIIGDVDYVPWLRIPGLELVGDEIKENEPAGTLVGTFGIIDIDEEELDLDPDEVYTLELVNSELYPDNDLFTIDDDFNLKSTAELNHENPGHTDGIHKIYVRVTDAWDNIWEGEFDIVVIDVNEAPTLTVEYPEDYEGEINELEEFTFTAKATDEDTNETLVFSLEGEPLGDVGDSDDAEIDPATGEFSWTPSEKQGPGDYTFDVCVSDGDADPVCETITITVNEVNAAPVADPDAYNVLKGTKLVVPAPGVLGNDTDADKPAGIPENTLSAVVVLPPAGGVLDLNPDGYFEFTPPDDAEEDDSFEFTYKVSDGAGEEFDLAKVTLTIKDNNQLPTAITFSPLDEEGIFENVDYEYLGTLKATDDDSDVPSVQHSFSLIGDYDDNAYFAIEYDKLIAKEPLDYEAKPDGKYTVYVRATDFFGRTIDQQVVITVIDANDAPVLTLSEELPTEVDEEPDEALTFTASATDEDTVGAWKALEFSLEDGDEGEVPDEAEIDPVSGEFSWEPTEAQGPGEYTFDVCVWDGEETDKLSDCETITITVNEVNVKPELTLPDDLDEEIPEEVEWTFLAEATDADSGPDEPLLNKLTFSLEGEVPEGAEIDPESGEFIWEPSEEQGGKEYTFTVKVCDDGIPSLCDEEEITIKVLEVNVAPVANDDFYAVTDYGLVVSAPGVLANDTDADIPANKLTVSSNSGLDPNVGTLVMYPNGSFRYTKPEDLSEEIESVTFTYTVSDVEDTVTASVSNSEDTDSTATVTLLLKNSPPVGIGLVPNEIEENEKFVGVLTTEDPNEADVHAYSLVDTCEGALDNDAFDIGKDKDGNDALIAEEPFDFEAKNSYSVCVRSTDLFGEYVDQKLDIRVIDVNEAPEAKSQDLTTSVNKPIEITLEGIDPEGSELTYAVFSFPTKGTLSVTEVPSINNFADNGVLAIVLRNLTYTPNPDFVEGEDSFTFKVMDATGLVSELATVTIKIEAAPTQQFIFLPIILK